MRHQTRGGFLAAASAFLAVGRAAAAEIAPLTDNGACALHDPLAVKRALEAGNARWSLRLAAMQHPHQTVAWRQEIGEKGQCPFATVLTCADSRVPPEVVFDRGAGDVFVCRTAGNVADPPVTGSIQFAAHDYHPGLLLVLGHQKCGAVEATFQYLRYGELPGYDIDSIVHLIVPAVRHIPLPPLPVSPQAKAAWIDLAVRANAQRQAIILRQSPIVRDQVGAHLQVYWGYYNVISGNVEFHHVP